MERLVNLCEWGNSYMEKFGPEKNPWLDILYAVAYPGGGNGVGDFLIPMASADDGLRTL